MTIIPLIGIDNIMLGSTKEVITNRPCGSLSADVLRAPQIKRYKIKEKTMT